MAVTLWPTQGVRLKAQRNASSRLPENSVGEFACLIGSLFLMDGG
jgi:hypothetical protein